MSRSSCAVSVRAWLVVGMIFTGSFPAFAATFTWNGTLTSGSKSWDTPSNWVGSASGTFPNAVDDVAQLRVNWTGAPTLNLNVPVTLARLSIGDSASVYYPVTIAPGTGGSLVFKSTSGTATLTKNNSINDGATTALRADVVSANIGLDAATFENNVANTTGLGRLQFSGSISAASAGLKTIAQVSTGTTGVSPSVSWVRYTGQIADGSGRVGITANSTSVYTIPLQLTGTTNAFSGPVAILKQTLDSFPASGTTGALGSGTVQLGDVSGTSSARLRLGGSLETVTEVNPIVVPAGSTGSRTIEVIDLVGLDNTYGGQFRSGNRILSGPVRVESAGGVTLACSGTSSLTFSNAISGTGPIAISSTGSGMVIFSGTGSTHSGTVTIQSRSMQLAGASSLAASTIVPLAGGTMRLAPYLQTAVGGLSPNAGGLVDVGNGMVTVAGGLSVANMLTAITAGYNGGTWTGTTGITSSTAAANTAAGSVRAIGWLDNGGGSVTFAFAAPGDVNLDGLIDVLDAATLSSAGRFNDTAAWSEGDFNYDGIYDDLDNALFVSTGLFDAGPYNTPPLAAGAIAPVPEPAAGGLIAAVAGAILLGGRSARRRAPRSEAGAAPHVISRTLG